MGGGGGAVRCGSACKKTAAWGYTQHGYARITIQLYQMAFI